MAITLSQLRTLCQCCLICQITCSHPLLAFIIGHIASEQLVIWMATTYQHCSPVVLCNGNRSPNLLSARFVVTTIRQRNKPKIWVLIARLGLIERERGQSVISLFLISHKWQSQMNLVWPIYFAYNERTNKRTMANEGKVKSNKVMLTLLWNRYFHAVAVVIFSAVHFT